jgi:hypothetical protein
MTRKEQFVRDLQQTTTLLGRNVDHYRSLVKQWFDEGYGGGGSDALTQAELDQMELSLLLADILAGIVLAQQVVNFNGNEPVTQADYAGTVAKLRTALS